MTTTFDVDTGEVKTDKPPGGGRAKRPSGAQRRKSAAQKSNLRENIHAALTVLGKSWEQVDDVCGGQFVARLPYVEEALVELALTDPVVAKWLGAFAAPGGWLGVGFAMMPVGLTVWAHHVTPAIAARRGEEFPEGEPPRPGEMDIGTT